MESVLNLIFSAENIRMLVLLAFGYVYLTRFRISFEKRIDNVEASIKELRSDMEASIKELRGDMEYSIKELRSDMEASIKELRGDMEYSIKELKTSLTGTIGALTYALEKNGSLKKEDKTYVDSRLAS